MFSRRNSIASSSGVNHTSSLHRTKSIISDSYTKSELLNSHEKSRQAIAAAQHAFASGLSKPLRARQPQHQTPISAHRRGLSEIDTNQPAYHRPQNLRFSRHGAPPESVTSQDYGNASMYSEVTPPKSLSERFNPDYCESVADDDTIIRRISLPQHGSGNYQARIFRTLSFESRDTPSVDIEDDGIHTVTPTPISSTPSSFKRIGKSKSITVMSSKYRPFLENDWQTERIPVETSGHIEQRKSMSFLRGGTDFMPQSMKQQQLEAKSKERMSFYTPSSARPMLDPSISHASMKGYRGRDDRGEWGALRWAVRKRARKITQVFGSVKSIFGKKKDERDLDSELRIPEQHILSSRLHFGDYTPNIPEAGQADYDDFAPLRRPIGPREKPKITSSYVVSKPPCMHIVPSSEQIRSDVGSISEVHTTPESKQRIPTSKDAYGTISTCSSRNWDSTIATQRPLTDQGDRMDNVPGQECSTRMPGKAPDTLIIPPRPQRRDRINVDVRRLYSALVKKMDDSPPQLKPIPARDISTDEEGHHTVLESSIHPELARALETRRSVLPPITNGYASAHIPRRSSRVTITGGSYQPPSPIPGVPKLWCNADTHGDMKRGSSDEYRPADEIYPSGSSVSSAKREAQHHDPRHGMTTVNPMLRSASRRKREVSFAEPSTPRRAVTSGVTDKKHLLASSPEVHMSVNGETQLSCWNLQILRNEQSSPGADSGVQSWQKQPRVSSSSSMHHNQRAPQAPSHSTYPPYAELHRSHSAAAYRSYNSSTPVRRTATAIGYTPPPRTGLVSRDVNILPIAYALRQVSLERRESRKSLSGRHSRASMKGFNVREAVKRQFGPVAGGEEEYQQVDMDGWYQRSAFL